MSKLQSLKTKMIEKKNAMLVMILAAVYGNASYATAISTDDDFYELYNMLDSWANGGLGVGLALAALMVGVIVGLGKSTVMPALIGIGFAALIALGPDIILDIITGGALI